MASSWTVASPIPKKYPAPNKNSFSPKGNAFYGHIHNQQDPIDRAGYKTAHAHNGFTMGRPSLEVSSQEKFRSMAYWDYKTPYNRAKYRGDAKLDKDGQFDEDVHWKFNREPGMRGHATTDEKTYGQASLAARNRAQIDATIQKAQERDIWLAKHNKDSRVKTRFEVDPHDPHLAFSYSSAQDEWDAKHSAARGRFSANASIPQDHYEFERVAPSEKELAEFVPSEADLAIRPEDYELSNQQLMFELKKAANEGDSMRVAALKIVRALREETKPPRHPALVKKPYAKPNSTMKFVNDWLSDHE